MTVAVEPRLRSPLRLDLLSSPLFLAALVTLLLNDHLFKRAFPGFLTGKLSDVAGLFAFTLFWLALFPARRTLVAGVIAVSFIVWKLPLVQPAIDFWNRHTPLTVARTVDATDLLALAVLPLAILHAASARTTSRSKWVTSLIALASVAAFAATSFYSPYSYALEYEFAGTPEELGACLRDGGITWYPIRDPLDGTSAEWRLIIPADICFDRVQAAVVVQHNDAGTQVSLTEISHRCPRGRNDARRLLDLFDASVVQPLQLERIR